MAEYLEILSDEKAMTVTVGDKVFTDPHLIRRRERDTTIKEAVCGDAPWHEGVKAAYQYYGSKLGAKFNRRFQAAHYWLWLGNRVPQKVADMLRFDGKNWNVYSDELVARAHKVLPYVLEAYGDGLPHLIPAIVVFQDTPSGIRRAVGKATWRRIAHNSMTRNKRIMQRMLHLHPNKDWGESFVRLLDYPSGVLSAAMTLNEVTDIAARLTPRMTPVAFDHTFNIVRDTQRMLGARFNPDWSLSRMHREHTLAVREVRAKKYPDTPFAAPWRLALDGYEATLLNTPLQVALEGDQQRHCVGSYAYECRDGRYAAFRIEGKERATLGLHRDGQRWVFSQCYGACNYQVSASTMAFAQHVIAVMNDQKAVAA